jgi:hypothetical protein
VLGPDAGEQPRRAVSSRVPAVGAEAGALAIVLVAAGVLFSRALDLLPSFDEGVYLGQVDALVHGQRLGTDVFAAQPPAFYWLLRAAAWIGDLGLHELRVAVLCVALAGVVLVYAVGRFAAGPAAGVIAAAALTIAPSYGVSAARVSADLPGTVLALASLACLLAPWTRGRRTQLALAGVLFAVAELVKLDAFLLVIPVALFAARRRLAVADLIAGTAGAVATFAVAALALGGSIPAVWRGAVSYHVDARTVSPGYAPNIDQLQAFFHPRQPFTTLAAVALLATIVYHRRTRSLWPFWLAALAALAFVLWHRPIHDNHIVLLAVAAAMAVGISVGAVIQELGRGRALAAVGLVVVVAAGYAQNLRQMDRNAQPIPAELTWAADRVAAATSPGALVISDEPLVPFLAHRRMPGRVIDTALLRFRSGYLDDRAVIRAAADPHVAAVVVGRAFLSRPHLLAWVARHFVRVGERDGVSVYVRRS